MLSEIWSKVRKKQAFIVEKIADGDLTVDVPIRSQKDLLGQKLSEMVHNITI